MSRIFISHASKDNFEAVALQQWLAREGWSEVFFDLDPEQGISPGERWERALHAAATRCEAIIFLVSQNWLDSTWCLKEYGLARGLNKKLFAAMIDPAKRIEDLPPELKGTWQAVDLAGGQDLQLFPTSLPGSHEEKHIGFARDGLRRLKRGLEKAGLDPKYFSWPPPLDPGRTPYRGLKPLDALDAGIFFGRDAAIIEARDRIQGLATGAAPRLLVILGASGAGKSSFLRAGVMSRLRRDDGHFVALPVIRPDSAALFGETGLLQALVATFPNRTRASLRDAIVAGAHGLRPLLSNSAQAAADHRVDGDGAARPPVIVIAIDQAEELFRAEGGDESLLLLSIMRDLMVTDEPAVMAIFAIRSDAYDALEHAKPLEGMAQATLPLLPMPRASYVEVIEGPARRFRDAAGRFEIEPRLTSRVLQDLESGGGSDALPLLAFTLEQLFLEYHQAGTIGLADYERFGGLKGTIQAAIDRAFSRADADPRIPRDRKAREALLRRGLIPWLAGIDPDTRNPRRNRARLSDIPAEAAPLIELLVEERLLSSDTEFVTEPDSGAPSRLVTIEPTHEALLRQWGLLDGWLKDDLGFLTTLEGIKRASRDWSMNARGESWLAHAGLRLAEALALDARRDIAARLDAVDRAYLDGCKARDKAGRAERERQIREREEAQARRIRDAEDLAEARRRTARRTLSGLVAASGLLVVVALVAALAFSLWRKTGEALTTTQAALSIVSSQTDLRDGRDEAAVLAARHAFELRPSPESRSALLAALLALSPYGRGITSIGGRIGTALVWLDAGHVAVGLASGDVLYREPSSRNGGETAADPVVVGNDGILALARSGDGGAIAVHGDGRGLRVKRDSASQPWFDPVDRIEAVSATAAAMSLSRDGRTLMVASATGGLVILRHKDGRRDEQQTISPEVYFKTVALSPDGRSWAAMTGDASIVAGETARASPGTPLPSTVKAVALAWSRDASYLAAGSLDGTLTVFDRVHPDREPWRRRFGSQSLAGLAWSPAGDRLALPCDHVVCVWKPPGSEAGACDPPPVLRLSGLRDPIRTIAWSPEGDGIAALDIGGALRFWGLAADASVRVPLGCGTSASLRALVAAPDGRILVAGSDDGDLVRWAPPDVTPAVIGHGPGGPVADLALDSSGDLAAAREDGTLTTLTAPATPEPVTTEIAPDHALSGVSRLTDRWAVLTRENSEVDGVAPGTSSLAVSRNVCPARPGVLGEALASDRAGQRLYVSVAGKLDICDLATGRWSPPIDVPGDRTVAAQSLAMSPDGRWLAKSGGDHFATVLDLAGTAAPDVLPTGGSDPQRVAASPDSRRLAILGSDGAVSIWAVSPGTKASRELTFDGITALPDHDPDVKAVVTAITWVGNDRLAVATSLGEVSLIGLDPLQWLLRADRIDDASPSGQQ